MQDKQRKQTKAQQRKDAAAQAAQQAHADAVTQDIIGSENLYVDAQDYYSNALQAAGLDADSADADSSSTQAHKDALDVAVCLRADVLLAACGARHKAGTLLGLIAQLAQAYVQAGTNAQVQIADARSLDLDATVPVQRVHVQGKRVYLLADL